MSEDAVWDALARALSGEYDIVAQLGIGKSGAPVYLARELVTDNFVAIRLPPLVSGNEAQEYGLEVVRQIDASLPEINARCPHCSAKVREWSRFCMRCGSDISGIAPSATGQSRDELRTLARNAAEGKYDVLGEMARADGGGLVYFGRELATGKILGLQLEQGPGATVTMRPTQFAAPDPSIQIPVSRHASAAQLARLSVPKAIDRGSWRTNGASSARATVSSITRLLRDIPPRTLAVVAIVILLILGWVTTCQLL